MAENNGDDANPFSSIPEFLNDPRYPLYINSGSKWTFVAGVEGSLNLAAMSSLFGIHQPSFLSATSYGGFVAGKATVGIASEVAVATTVPFFGMHSIGSPFVFLETNKALIITLGFGVDTHPGIAFEGGVFFGGLSTVAGKTYSLEGTLPPVRLGSVNLGGLGLGLTVPLDPEGAAGIHLIYDLDRTLTGSFEYEYTFVIDISDQSADVVSQLSALVSDDPQAVIDALLSQDAIVAEIGTQASFADALEVASEFDEKILRAKQLEAQGGLCFAAGTPVRMADGSEKPIDQVKVGEWVMSFDPDANNGRGKLVPSQVTRTMVNHGQLLLDFHGTKVTPGHVFLTGEKSPIGKGVFKRLIDILIEDGTVVNAEGTALRAATNFPVGSPEDRIVEVAEIWPENGSIGSRPARLRAGTWLIGDDGAATTLLDSMTREGFELLPDGRVSHRGGPSQPMLILAPVPRPETYVLKRSGLTLEQIYAHACLRDVAPAAMAAQAMRRSSGIAAPAAGGLQLAAAGAGGGWPQGWTPSADDGDTLSERRTAPKGNRVARRRAEAQARKQAKRKMHS